MRGCWISREQFCRDRKTLRCGWGGRRGEVRRRRGGPLSPDRVRSPLQHRGRHSDKLRQNVQIGSSRQVSVTVIFPGCGQVVPGAVLALAHSRVCIVGITRLMPGVHQPDPPGLIHDDLRLLPPWRGSSLLWGVFARRIDHFSPRTLRNDVFVAVGGRSGIPKFRLIHRYAGSASMGLSGVGAGIDAGIHGPHRRHPRPGR